MTERTRNYFDRMAGGWDRGANDDDLHRRLAALVARFRIPRGGWVLDVGTGTGILHPYLLSAVGESGRVLAFDFSSCMLAEALKKSCPENLACFQADVTAIPLPDGIFDNVICFAAFPHFNRKHEALQEMARVARPGGRVVIAHLLSRTQIARHHDANPEVAGHYLPPDERMRRLLADTGFEAMTIEDAPGRYLAMAEKKATDMKKNKARLREKIRNRPKARNTSKRKKREGAKETLTEDSQRPHSQPADQGMDVMSQVILDFAAPLLETCSDEAAERKAISLAIYVWNTAMLPEPECRRILEAYLAECQKVVPPEELNTLSDYIDRLVQTRRTRFANNRNKITNCTFGDYGPDRHIEVGYTME